MVGHLFDDDTNTLHGHVAWRRVDEPEFNEQARVEEPEFELTTEKESTPIELLVASSSQLEKAIQTPTFTMSLDEWSERYKAMIAAGAFMEEQFRVLSTARIENTVPAVGGADGAEQLTPQQFADRIRLMLEANPALLSGGTSNALVQAFKELPESSSSFGVRQREL